MGKALYNHNFDDQVAEWKNIITRKKVQPQIPTGNFGPQYAAHVRDGLIDQGFAAICHQVDICDMVACIYVRKNAWKFTHIMPAFIFYPSTGYKVIDRNRVMRRIRNKSRSRINNENNGM